MKRLVECQSRKTLFARWEHIIVLTISVVLIAEMTSTDSEGPIRSINRVFRIDIWEKLIICGVSPQDNDILRLARYAISILFDLMRRRSS